MIRVRLYELAGTGLIFPATTGVTYLNQVGGTACLQYELEGFFVPFANHVAVPAGTLLPVEKELWSRFAADGTGGFNLRDADFVDKVMKAFGVSVNRRRISQCVEAWVHVWVTGFGEQVPLVEGLGRGPHAAVLTWSNSD